LIGANAGRKFSPETKRKMSLAHQGKSRTAEFCEKTSKRQMILVKKVSRDGVLLCEYDSMKLACKHEKMAIQTLRAHADSVIFDKKRSCFWKVTETRK